MGRKKKELEAGPTGEFPEGRISPEDEGELSIAIAPDLKRRVLVINFGTRVLWIGMSKREALEFADVITRRAMEIPDDATSETN